MRPFKKVLVANRSEIAIRIFRACTELGIQTVAIYADEDRLSLHRYKADEAYLIGKSKSAVDAYLDIEGIVNLALEKDVDAIHPGYGFLAENAELARACKQAGIVFVGPPAEVLEALGDKVKARAIAQRAKVPVIPGTKDAVKTDQDALLFAKKHGFPLIIKAAHGGGGRGMTIVQNREELLDAIARSRSEASKAFGSPKVFIERYLERPKHIEVQVMADAYGNMVHLFERDCSIQRRHQKVIEIAPSRSIKPAVKDRLYRDALSICREVGYVNAGTVEFLVDKNGKHYFIEVNPRIQVEHTITEIITGRDIVQTQLRVAEGYSLDHDTIRIPGQEKVKKSGYAIQLRITAEDPTQNFAPTTGKLTAFRAGEGFGIRLDAGNGFEGAVISPHYDSLLIKLCSWSLDFDLAVTKALRAIREFRIRGVRTNLPFLENVVDHERFRSGDLDTRFIDDHPELMRFKPRKNRANKLLRYLGDLAVNGYEGIAACDKPVRLNSPPIPSVPKTAPAETAAYEVFREQGATGLSKWLLEQKRLLITDTTTRDAHQSLFATRLRSYDMFAAAHATGHLLPELFSMEMWGGATFDVSMRFLKECPWERLTRLRKLLPGTLLQMLLRSGNAVGYTNYPDNVVNRFIKVSAEKGIDVFRIFDCLNWVESMKPCIAAVAETGKIAEAAVCYTGDVSDTKREKFNLAYYLQKAKELEAAGCHILAIKDMAGLLKPRAAYMLVDALKNALQIPVHLHTHDTSGNGIATLLEATRAGVDIVDTALSSMSGTTSQPSMNALVTALYGTERETGIRNASIQQLADYWEVAREAYAPFECGLKAGTAEVYRHEIPGGQYSNLRPQAIALGLGHRWNDIKVMYRTVNDMLGEVIKVTPSSKAVGDMALFMVQNDLTPQAVLDHGKEMAFPESFVNLMKGMMGQPDGGFPAKLQKAVLKDEQPITCRPGQLLEDFDFDAAAQTLEKKFGRSFKETELVSYSLYPQVFTEYIQFVNEYGDLSVLDTPTFFYGLDVDQEKAIAIEEGKTLILKLLARSEPHEDGFRELFFELNGRPRNVMVLDKATGIEVKTNEKADPDNPKHVAAPMSGKVTELHVAQGEKVSEGQKLMTTEAMKMLNVIVAPRGGKIKRLPVAEGMQLGPGDLVAEIG
ncbi:pyruvate carboxylase [Sulfidibacter corallicola]|uniref:Pyruvate carboxylase n=1 Tax=Sulfidibacter corallicola TaxID=2818388 RepID=A0A8A4TYV4_SULCO|nr:pyruvate carboxylase [Sulfidibacter corallicola]